MALELEQRQQVPVFLLRLAPGYAYKPAMQQKQAALPAEQIVAQELAASSLSKVFSIGHPFQFMSGIPA